MIIYIDAFAILFRSYYAVKGLTAKDGTPTGALYGMVNSLLRIISALKPDHIVACFDGPEKTLRQEADENYKANRDDAEEEFIVQIPLAKELLQALSVHVVEKKGFEADDLLGTLATQDANDGHEVIVVSCDGDLLQLTTNKNIRVYYLKQGINDFVLYDEDAVQEKNGYPARHIVDFKGLAGDKSDNIKGVAGIGKTFAMRLINAYGGLEDIYTAVEAGKLQGDGFTERTNKLLVEGKESAFFSRDLATIPTDVAITRPHLKGKQWRERIVLETAVGQMEQYGFASLIAKLKKVLGAKHEENVVRELDPVLVKRASIALWVLDATHTNASAEEVLSYTHTDTIEDALKETEKQLAETKRTNIWKEIEEPLIPVLEKLEKRGIAFDVEKCAELSALYREKLATITQKIYTEAGKEFNINSPKQLSEVLFTTMKLGGPKSSKKTASGIRSTREAVLVEMKDEHPIIPLILEYRHYEKLRSTYVDALPTFLDDAGRIHTTLQQNGTTTGRMSSKNPNLQNIPASGQEGKNIRNLFIAQKGWKLLAVDYAQMEMRIAAILSGDEQMIGIFQRETDIHQAVAAKIFNISEEAVTFEQRTSAKAINFGILYGMGAQSLYKSTDISLTEAREFLTAYKKAFPKLFEFMDHIRKEAKEKGFVTTAFGRARPIEGIHSALPFVRAQAEREAINAPIQGTAADIIKQAMIAIDALLVESSAEQEVRMLLQIHDELLFEIQENHVDVWKEKIQEAMESVFPVDKKPIPLKTEMQVGDAWGDLRKK